jgi:hypothetical protein
VVAATGCDVIDAEAFCDPGIAVSNMHGYALNALPEQTMALIVALLRPLIGFRQDVIMWEWQKILILLFYQWHSVIWARSSPPRWSSGPATRRLWTQVIGDTNAFLRGAPLCR